MDKNLPKDSEPKSGEWVDSEKFFEDLTDEEIAAGEHDGAETPDVDYIEIEGKRYRLDELPEDEDE